MTPFASLSLLPSRAQVTCLQQGRVAALSDSSASLALVNPDEPYELLTKPHGHGDVHALMHRSGLAARWERLGVHWLYFLQDSSTSYFSHHLASLGAAIQMKLDAAFVAAPRLPKMAIGILATLTHATTGAVRPPSPSP